MRLLVAACSLGMPMHLPVLRSCRSMHSSIVMNTNRDAPPPTKMAAIEAALATKATQPVILLARPFAPGNIGAVARAMLNFGLSDLRLVAPLTQPWLTEEAQARACGAAPLLDEAQTFVVYTGRDGRPATGAGNHREAASKRARADAARRRRDGCWAICGSNHAHTHPHPARAQPGQPEPEPEPQPSPRPGLSPALALLPASSRTLQTLALA